MKKIAVMFLAMTLSVNAFAAGAAKTSKTKNVSQNKTSTSTKVKAATSKHSFESSIKAKLFEEIERGKGTKITIKQAVKMALTDSFQIYTATKMKEIYDEAKNQANSSYYPYINLNAGYDRVFRKVKALNDQDKMVTPRNANNTYFAQLSANWVLWTGGKISKTKEYIELQAKSADYQLEDTKTAVAKEVAQYCYSIIYASALVHVQETYLDIAKQHLAETKARYKQGLSSNLDVLTQQVRVDNIMPQVLQAKKNLDLSTLYLRQILNKDPEFPMFLTWTEKDLTVPNTKDIQQLYNDAYEHRPELIVSRIAVQMAETNYKLAKTDFYPTLSAYGNYGYYGATMEGLPFDGYHHYWSANAGLKLSLPLFEGFSTKSQVKQKKLYYENAQASYDNLKKTIRIEVKAAWLIMQEAKQRIESTRGVVEQAQENLNSKMLRYRNGLISQLELNDAISDLNDSNLSYVQAVYDAHVALSDLNYAVGLETKDYE